MDMLLWKWSTSLQFNSVNTNITRFAGTHVLPATCKIIIPKESPIILFTDIDLSILFKVVHPIIIKLFSTARPVILNLLLSK